MNRNSQLLLTCQQLTKHFATRNGPVTALLEVNLELATNEFVCIFLEETWQLDPGNVNSGHMRSFLQGRSEEN
ncbi:MAG: hypothetical protein R3E79_05570 [Caldilineaceae bacterium]